MLLKNKNLQRISEAALIDQVSEEVVEISAVHEVDLCNIIRKRKSRMMTSKL